VAFSLRDTLTIFAEMNVPVATIRLGGGGARARFGGRFRLMCTDTRSRILALKKGPLTEPRCWLESAAMFGRQ